MMKNTVSVYLFIHPEGVIICAGFHARSVEKWSTERQLRMYLRVKNNSDNPADLFTVPLLIVTFEKVVCNRGRRNEHPRGSVM